MSEHSPPSGAGRQGGGSEGDPPGRHGMLLTQTSEAAVERAISVLSREEDGRGEAWRESAMTHLLEARTLIRDGRLKDVKV